VKPELAGVNVVPLSNMSADAKKTDAGALYGRVTGVYMLEMILFESTLRERTVFEPLKRSWLIKVFSDAFYDRLQFFHDGFIGALKRPYACASSFLWRGPCYLCKFS